MPAERQAPSAFPNLVAIRELRRSNPSAPVEALRDRVVLLGVPEGAAVHAVGGVNAHGAIVAPAVGGVRLRTAAANHLYLGFQLSEAQRIVNLASRHVNRRVRRCATGTSITAGFAIAEQDVANLVSGYRTHPTPVAIRSVGALLEDAESRRRNILDRGGELKPPRGVLATRGSHVEVDKPVLRESWFRWG